jgi:alpha-aminoadipic semialdehyde synthase
MFFSHTIKGQPHNMPMLRRILERRCTLFDHELVTGEDGKRLIAFGRYAGIAGAIDGLWILGRRLLHEGHATPFAKLHPAHAYSDLEDARRAVREVGSEIRSHGISEALRPMVIGLTGRGNVGAGAREILDLLPRIEVRPDDLPSLPSDAAEGRSIALTHWHTSELIEPRSGVYSREEFRAHPQSYRSRFAPSLAYLTLLLHGIHWTYDSPRFVTREDLRRLFRGSPRLRAIVDVTCDVNGSLECTVRTTDPGSPAYTYDPESGTVREGIEGSGPVVLPVEIFPAELPLDASRHFSRALSPMIPGLSRMDPAFGPQDPVLPASLKRSAIAARGTLLPPWEERLKGALFRHGETGADRKSAA